MEHYSFIVPLMKTLIGKLSDSAFVDEDVLSELNAINSGPGFFESFQGTCRDNRWISFIEMKVCNKYDLVP